MILSLPLLRGAYRAADFGRPAPVEENEDTKHQKSFAIAPSLDFTGLDTQNRGGGTARSAFVLAFETLVGCGTTIFEYMLGFALSWRADLRDRICRRQKSGRENDGFACFDAVGPAQRVGRLAPGLDADIAVFSGPPISIHSKCLMTIINGKIIYERRQ